MRLQKSLSVGVILLIISFLFFYFASIIDYDFVSVYNETVDMRGGTWSGFGGLFDAYRCSLSKPVSILMQPNDYLYLTVTSESNYPFNGTVYIVLWQEMGSGSWNVSKYSSATSLQVASWLDFRTSSLHPVYVGVDIASSNRENKLSTTLTIHHYQSPHMMLFGLGMIIAVLALVVTARVKWKNNVYGAKSSPAL